MTRKFTDAELLEKVKSINSFKSIPNDYWILGIRSIADISDKFDDKFYLFKGEQCIMVTSGTTNPGKNGLLDPDNSLGCAVVKDNEWYYNLWQYGLHKAKMPALKQAAPIKFYRDDNKDLKSDESGKLYNDIIGINFHCDSYNQDVDFIKSYVGQNIGLWSEGCQVCNDLSDYYRIIDLTKLQKSVSYCLIKEF